MRRILKQHQPLFWDLGQLLLKFRLILALFLLGLLISVSAYQLHQLILDSYQGVVKRLYQSSQTDFIRESFDIITQNYWQQVDSKKLATLFTKASDKVSGKSLLIKGDSEEEFLKGFYKYLKSLPPDKRDEFAAKTVAIVMSNLSPFGRSSLYTKNQETKLQNTVENIHPEKNLYQDLGLPSKANEKQVADAFQLESQKLEKLKESSPEAREKLKQLSYASQVLTNPDTKSRYDQMGAEPITSSKAFSLGVYYIKLDRFSSSSFEEFKRNIQTAKVSSKTFLVIDLRGNIGGAIDLTANFIGSFVGSNKEAFNFYHQSSLTPVLTSVDAIAQLKSFLGPIILIDHQTQSSAEILVASLKRYHLGVVVGQTTRGWGTVERVFPLQHQLNSQESYSLFLVHSLTLREDNLPIEGRGVEPQINTTLADWKNKLFEQTNSMEVVDRLSEVLGS